MRLLASPEGVAERSESFKIMIAGGNHSKIKKLSDGSSEPAGLTDEGRRTVGQEMQLDEQYMFQIVPFNQEI